MEFNTYRTALQKLVSLLFIWSQRHLIAYRVDFLNLKIMCH